MNYLGQDRSEVQFAVKELGKDLASPSQESWMKLERLLRYLKGSPRLRMKYSYQHNDRTITAWTDSDFAGCIKSRKSTSAGVTMSGNHLVKSWSTNQSVIALSSGEAEYYSMVKAGSVALGIESLMKDLGVEDTGSIAIKTDTSAAIGIGSRIGIGTVRHIVNQLWLQEKVASGRFKIIKVPTNGNLADALTKGVDVTTIGIHLAGVNAEVFQDRHSLAPKSGE